MLFVLFGFSCSQMFQLNYTTSFPVNTVLSYGFNHNGKYKISVKSKKAIKTMLILTKDPFLKEPVDYYCSNRQNIVKEYNISINNSNDTLLLNGVISEKGIYKLFLISCTNKHVTYEMNCSFSNPNSLLDYRNRYIGPMFRFMSLVYCCVFGFWFAQYPILQIFKYPLHTTFMFLPLLRALNLYIWYAKWGILAKTDVCPKWLDFCSHALDVVFFTTSLSSMLFLCEGCNIYRVKFGFMEHVDIIAASFSLTFGIKMIPFAKNEPFLIIAFWLIIGGMVLYFSLGVTSIIKARKIMSMISAKAPLRSKIVKSRKIVSVTYFVNFVTITIYIAMYLDAVPDFISSCFLEFGLFTCIIIMLLFYTEIPSTVHIVLPKKSNYRPVFLKSPCSTELVFVCGKNN